ncbi:hypothetical protein [Paraglaciecola sp.]|uniref:hypothetical protein n=1 Tax=Paraglaciecola sp. TaxID=1920173 RepID=UPI003EF11644
MKFLAVLFSLALAFNANAGLITAQADQTSYNTGDTVTVDLYINNLNPIADYLLLDYAFDSSELAFDSFQFADSVWDNTEGFLDADGSTFDGLIAFTIDLVDNWSDTLGTSFKLGQGQFTALQDSVSADFDLSILLAEDANFNVIPDDQIQVSAPSGIALFSLFAGLVFMRKRNKA